MGTARVVCIIVGNTEPRKRFLRWLGAQEGIELHDMEESTGMAQCKISVLSHGAMGRAALDEMKLPTAAAVRAINKLKETE